MISVYSIYQKLNSSHQKGDQKDIPEYSRNYILPKVKSIIKERMILLYTNFGKCIIASTNSTIPHWAQTMWAYFGLQDFIPVCNIKLRYSYVKLSTEDAKYISILKSYFDASSNNCFIWTLQFKTQTVCSCNQCC